MLTRATPEAQAPAKTRWQRFAERRLLNVVMGLMVVALCGAVLFPHVVMTVPAGHVGVLWKRIGGYSFECWCWVPRGTVLEPGEIRQEGLHIIWPWDDLVLYNLRLQTATRSFDAISNDGVRLSASISVRFQLQHDSVAQVHKFIGPGYADMIVMPIIGSRARDVISKYSAEAVYSRERGSIQDELRVAAEKNLAEQLNRLVQPEVSDQIKAPPPALEQRQKRRSRASEAAAATIAPSLHNAIEILDTLVLGIELPPAVVAAINRKIEQFYVAQEYEFRVQRERLESTRKAIEAAGIKDFQQTVSQGISESYLRWRGIEATLQLSQSNNTKIVIVGGGKDGLPIILGNVDAAPAPAAPASTPPSGTPERTNTTDRLSPANSPPNAPSTSPPSSPADTSAAPAPQPPTDSKTGDATPPPPSASDKLRSMLTPNLSDVRSMILGTPKAAPPAGEPKATATAAGGQAAAPRP
jgi:prohibitin 2